MKTISVLIIISFTVIFTSCQKEYVCACRDIHTGEKVYGGRFKTGPVFKRSARESCKSNSRIYKADFEHCHLE